jgi:hypothetical protein
MERAILSLSKCVFGEEERVLVITRRYSPVSESYGETVRASSTIERATESSVSAKAFAE